MIRRSTWIILALFVLAIGAYFALKSRPLKSTAPTPTVLGNTMLVTIGTDQLQGIRVSDNQNKITQIERDMNGQWKVTLPAPAPADQGLAEEAATQVGAINIVTNLQTSPDLTAIGLGTPAYTITLTFKSNAQHTIEVGILTPTSSGYYVRYDKGSVFVVSQNSIDSLTNLLNSPPYIPTATLEPTQEPSTPVPTDTPMETVQPSPTPTSVTATP